MKKLLLGSTALAVGGLMAAPAMAADPIKMGVGGYYQFYALGRRYRVAPMPPNGTSTQYKGVQFIQEGEIHFIGQTKMDNGTTVGLRVELEGWNPRRQRRAAPATPSDRRSLSCSPSATGAASNSAPRTRPYVMYYGAPSALLGFGFIQHNTIVQLDQRFANANNKAAFHISASTIGAQFQDVNRINYYTPRFAGLQIGVGYAPKININSSAAGAQGLRLVRLTLTSAASAASTTPRRPTTARPTTIRGRTVVDIGANYLNKFGDVTVAALWRLHVRQLRPGLLAVRWRCEHRLPAPTWHRGSSGSPACSSASPASRSAARRLRQQRPGRQLLHRRRQRHPRLLRRPDVRNRPVADLVRLGRLVQHQR